MKIPYTQFVDIWKVYHRKETLPLKLFYGFLSIVIFNLNLTFLLTQSVLWFQALPGVWNSIWVPCSGDRVWRPSAIIYWLPGTSVGSMIRRAVDSSFHSIMKCLHHKKQWNLLGTALALMMAFEFVHWIGIFLFYECSVHCFSFPTGSWSLYSTQQDLYKLRKISHIYFLTKFP